MKNYITKDEARQLAKKYHVDIENERYIPLGPDGLHKLCNEVIQIYINNLYDEVNLPHAAGMFSFIETYDNGAFKESAFEFFPAQQMRDALANKKIKA